MSGDRTDFREVPLRVLVMASVALVVVTIATMVFFLHFDPDAWSDGSQLGLKVGQIVLSEKQLAEFLAEPSAVVASSAHLQTLLDTLVLAESARESGLIESPEFKSRLAAFEAATAGSTAEPPSGGPENSLPRLVFILEELADLARAQARNLAGPADPALVAAAMASTTVGRESAATASGAVAGHPAHPRVRAREILLDSATAAEQLLVELAAGRPFEVLAASWSTSPYAGVGGDLGWVDPSRLPDEATKALHSTPVGSTTLAFRDDAGCHLLLIDERVGMATATRLALAQAQIREGLAAKAERELLNDARRRIPTTLGRTARAILGR